jgi:multiple sugar transport system ATP-binding protein
VARIELKNLVKKFGNLVAVAGVNLEIPEGEFLILVGPSGCGKTTTLNMISGLETPTSGEVCINELVVNEMDPGERDLGMVFQDLALFPHMTVFENIAFGLKVKGIPRDEVNRRVREAAETMLITKLLEKKPAQCSGGEAQRVALARTIVTNPSVFLMDEPLSSLDAKLRVDMRTELKHLHERIIVMKDGYIQQAGGPLEIYGHPNNQFVAGFFGTPTMNFISGTLKGEGENLVFRSKNLEEPLPSGRGLRDGGRGVTLGVRSEHVLIGQGSNKGKIRLTEPLGDETLVFFEYGGDQPLVAKVEPEKAFSPGDAIEFGFEKTGFHIFDGESGDRLN